MYFTGFNHPSGFLKMLIIPTCLNSEPESYSSESNISGISCPASNQDSGGSLPVYNSKWSLWTLTSWNSGELLKAAITEWMLPTLPPVSDNAKNMAKAAELLNTGFCLGCFAHILNLGPQKASQVPCVGNLLAKVRRIVAFFQRSAVSATALKIQTDLYVYLIRIL